MIKLTERQEDILEDAKAWSALIIISGIIFFVSKFISKGLGISPWPFFFIMFFTIIGMGLSRLVRVSNFAVIE